MGNYRTSPGDILSMLNGESVRCTGTGVTQEGLGRWCLHLTLVLTTAFSLWTSTTHQRPSRFPNSSLVLVEHKYNVCIGAVNQRIQLTSMFRSTLLPLGKLSKCKSSDISAVAGMH